LKKGEDDYMCYWCGCSGKCDMRIQHGLTNSSDRATQGQLKFADKVFARLAPPQKKNKKTKTAN